MRVWLTGGTGFVGSNIVHVALEAGHQVLTTVHTFRRTDDLAYGTEQVDITDPDAVRRSVEGFGPDVVIHSAILNDFARMYAERTLAWQSFVEATRACAAAADAAGAPFVVVSTDWVFDGTQAPADEATPPNPVNIYGVLKMASELVAIERGGAVARVSGVNGLHRARPRSPRSQDPGFGYFVASLVDALSRGERFMVWESPDINMRATPSLATESAEMMLQIGLEGLTGMFHCCGGDSVSRMELAELACDVFDLDDDLIHSGPPPASAMLGAPVPYDTSLVMPRTSELLRRRPTPVRHLLERFRAEYEAAA